MTKQTHLLTHPTTRRRFVLGTSSALACASLPLRYEIKREFAPYIGVKWGKRFGQTAELAGQEGESRTSVNWLAGIRFWF